MNILSRCILVRDPTSYCFERRVQQCGASRQARCTVSMVQSGYTLQVRVLWPFFDCSCVSWFAWPNPLYVPSPHRWGREKDLPSFPHRIVHVNCIATMLESTVLGKTCLCRADRRIFGVVRAIFLPRHELLS